MIVACGDPAEEAARIVRERLFGLVVIGLHSSPSVGPRMGSVTYSDAVFDADAGARAPAPTRLGGQPAGCRRLNRAVNAADAR